MINSKHLDSKELRTHGLIFETEEEARLFSEVIKSELEVRIGMAIADGIDEQRLEEFSECRTDEESQEWLELNRPDYRDIVASISAKFACELFWYRDRIPGLTIQIDPKIENTSLEDLDLSVRSYNYLKRENLTTVGAILAYGDLRGIRNLGNKCINEINVRISELCFQSTEKEFLNAGGTDD
jgi:DNA-directed RNA polymerase alpha subunit